MLARNEPLVTLLLFSEIISVVCSVGWVNIYNGSSCYHVYNDTTQKLSFWNAKKWCQEQDGSRLTSVLSKEENRFLGYLINETQLGPNETFYIGLRLRNKQSNWEWVDNQPYNYTNWYQDQEPQPDEKQSSANCVFYNHVNQWELGASCRIKRLFICKQQQPTGISIHCNRYRHRHIY